MKKLIITTIFLLVSIHSTSNAQSLNFFQSDLTIAVSPYSISLWGATPNSAKVMIEYRDIELMFVHAWSPINFAVEGDRNKVGEHNTHTYKGSFIALFVTPFNFKYRNLLIEGGIGYFFRKFPDPAGSNVNFTLEASYMITEHIGVSYSHISNGFGAFNQLNPGLDSFSIVYSF